MKLFKSKRFLENKKVLKQIGLPIFLGLLVSVAVLANQTDSFKNIFSSSDSQQIAILDVVPESEVKLEPSEDETSKQDVTTDENGDYVVESNYCKQHSPDSECKPQTIKKEWVDGAGICSNNGARVRCDPEGFDAYYDGTPGSEVVGANNCAVYHQYDLDNYKKQNYWPACSPKKSSRQDFSVHTSCSGAIFDMDGQLVGCQDELDLTQYSGYWLVLQKNWLKGTFTTIP